MPPVVSIAASDYHTASFRRPFMTSPNTPADLRHDSGVVRSDRLASARQELAAASERGEGGRVALRQYSHRVDALIQQLFADAGAVAQPIGVFALGGYGRRELCLHSDIDLLLLFSGTI